MKKNLGKKGYIVAAFGAALFLIIGFLIGFFAFAPSKSSNNNGENPINKYYETIIEESNVAFREKLINEISSENIRRHLKTMTSYPHMAGEDGDLKSANYVYDNWVAQKLDYVKKIDYDVFLSYPDYSRPNSIGILNADNTTNAIINITEPIYDKDLDYSKAAAPFLAYGMNGSVTSTEIYYANFCRDKDFEYLLAIGLNLNNSIVICKYGRIFRGDKVIIAQKYGVHAVLLYDDPKRSAPSFALNERYPNGEYLPEYGTQRGTLFTGNGDPLTPLYPSTENAYREKESSNAELPKIVAQVIGYKHAEMVFQLMEDNQNVNESEWIGELNVNYTYGGKLKNGMSFIVNVYNERKIAKTYNVIGIINGETEPDQYILLGNHRDAWVFGSVDPTSGTAAMLEVSRALSDLKRNKGWRPKRSILFLSWGAEEYGLIGSTEWVEEFNKKLSQNAIAYLNMDIAVQGNYSFTADASPLLVDVIYEVTKSIKLNSEETVYDRWLKYEPNEETNKPLVISALGAGSDFMGFQQRVGIASMDARFNHDYSDRYSTIGFSYFLYHTNYETFDMVDKFIDPGFKSFRVVSQVFAELTRVLSDSIIIPLNASGYVYEMEVLLKDYKDEYGEALEQQMISLEPLENAMKNFANTVKDFEERLRNLDKKKVHLIRQYNDQLKNLEKAFLDFEGMNRAGYLHMLSAPSLTNQYGGDGLPALSDATYAAIKDSKPENWEKVKFELSIVIYVIQSASSILREPNNFNRF